MAEKKNRCTAAIRGTTTCPQPSVRRTSFRNREPLGISIVAPYPCSPYQSHRVELPGGLVVDRLYGLQVGGRVPFLGLAETPVDLICRGEHVNRVEAGRLVP